MTLTPRFYCISGLIASGKSNLALTLANLTGGEAIKEVTDKNPYLNTFYEDLKANKCIETRSAIIMQLYLLNKRFGDHWDAIARCKDKVIISDRSLAEDTIFARTLYKDGHISEIDYQTYISVYNTLKHLLKLPVFIFIDITPEKALENAKQRARGCETNLTLEYLTSLHAEYQIFKKAMEKNSILVSIPAEEIYYPEKVIERLEELDKSLTYQDIIYSKL